MLEALSRRIAAEIKKADPDGPTSVEVMEYALAIKLTEISTIFFVSITGWLTGHFFGSLLALGSLMLIRRFSGGIHFSNLTLCVFFTTIVCIIIPFITLSLSAILITNVCSLLMLIAYAPNHFIYIHKTKNHSYYKLICIFMCLLNFFIQSPIICLSLAIQSFSILPLWRGGERKWI
ncbi:accessory gene regulator B [Paenibacillus brasilensis]|uniref:Accessory gene regulator B n=2 Tax=Paenibacillus brasilensis TaxID=128574 RepID=A0ABU0KVA1_9BACL|nr:accessory gene regulator B [Paenibacillus brasilensis]